MTTTVRARRSARRITLTSCVVCGAPQRRYVHLTAVLCRPHARQYWVVLSVIAAERLAEAYPAGRPALADWLGRIDYDRAACRLRNAVPSADVLARLALGRAG